MGDPSQTGHPPRRPPSLLPVSSRVLQEHRLSRSALLGVQGRDQFRSARQGEPRWSGTGAGRFVACAEQEFRNARSIALEPGRK